MTHTTWIVPFIYLAAMLGLYLFAPIGKRLAVQARMRKNPNFYMICDLVLIILAIPATMMYKHRWIDYLTWILLVVLVGVSARKALSEEPPQDEPGCF